MEQRAVERRLAAILAADVAGYSRLMEVDEEGTLAQLSLSLGSQQYRPCPLGGSRQTTIFGRQRQTPAERQFQIGCVVNTELLRLRQSARAIPNLGRGFIIDGNREVPQQAG